jgi:hypothetical protein
MGKEITFEQKRLKSIETLSDMFLKDKDKELIVLSIKANDDGSVSLMTGESETADHVYIHNFKSIKTHNPLKSSLIMTGSSPLVGLDGKAL